MNKRSLSPTSNSMRLFLLAALAASITAGANAQCEFCAGGLTVGIDTPVPNSGGETCGTLAEYAPTLDADEYFCTSVALPAEDLCCSIFTAQEEEQQEQVVTTSTVVTSATSTVAAVDVDVEPQTTKAPEDDKEDDKEDMGRPCEVCSDGLTVGEGTIIPYPESGGASCGQMIGYAADVDGDSDQCSEMKDAEAICCPTDEPVIADAPASITQPATTAMPPEEDNAKEDTTTCSVCPEGLTVEASTVIPYPEAGGASCEQMIGYASNVDVSSGQCSEMKDAEAICCPDADGSATDETETTQPATTTMAPDEPTDVTAQPATTAEAQEDDTDDDTCSVCPGGLTVGEGTIIPYPEAGGASCGQMIGYAANVEEDSDQCSEMKDAEAICCPTDEPAADATETTTTTDENDVCIICPDGFTVDEDLDIGQGATCGSLAANALKMDASSNTCKNMKGAETICCPTPAVNPCPICYASGGITVDESTFISVGRTCGGLVTDASNTEESSDICELMKGAEGICCPANNESGEDACVICADGLAVDADFGLGKGATCGSLVADALEFDSSSKKCEDMKEDYEASCCPPPAEEPCPVCPNGITVDESTVISESKGMTLTCGGLVVDASNTEESSDVCSQMMGGEAVCCPPLDELLITTTEMPTRTPTTEVPTPGTTTSAPVSSPPTASPKMTTTSVPTTTAKIASPVPTLGATPTITPTNTVTRASQAPTKNMEVVDWTTLIPTKKTAEEDSTTLAPSTYAPTTEVRPTVSPAGATTENLPASKPVVEEMAPQPSGSTCLRVVSSGWVGLVLTSIASIVYTLIDL